MSLTRKTGDKPVHFPENPNKFGFDGEVSAIFENMAERSIPNFRLAHRLHASMASQWLGLPQCNILDIGASRGSFLKEVIQKRGHQDILRGKIKYTAIDNSPEMCGHLKTDFPEITVRCEDVSSEEFLKKHSPQFDIVCAHYVLQFVHPDKQEVVFDKIASMVRPGGIFIFGHKAAHSGEVGVLAHEEYIDFRLGNGYTREEIEAKTQALRGSMWPMSDRKVQLLAEKHFSEIQETTRFMMFNTFFAIK